MGSVSNDSTASLAKSLPAKLVIAKPFSARLLLGDSVLDKEASAYFPPVMSMLNDWVDVRLPSLT